MNEQQKHSKVEMEILSHEKEMMHTAKIKKLNEGPLSDKINYVLAHNDKKSDWTVEEILLALDKEGLTHEGTTAENIEDILKNTNEGLGKTK